MSADVFLLLQESKIIDERDGKGVNSLPPLDLAMSPVRMSCQHRFHSDQDMTTGFHLILLRPGLSSNLEPTNCLDWLACDPPRPFCLGAHSAEIYTTKPGLYIHFGDPKIRSSCLPGI
ncbi:rCG51720, partial [Rattus norvegicus]